MQWRDLGNGHRSWGEHARKVDHKSSISPGVRGSVVQDLLFDAVNPGGMIGGCLSRL